MVSAWFDFARLVLQDGGIILCDECPCVGSATGTADCVLCDYGGPLRILVEITNVTNDSCDECENLNGSYILDWIGGCTWQIELSSSICGYSYLTYNINQDLITPDIYAVFSSEYNPNHFSGDCWRKSSLETEDRACQEWDKLDLPNIYEYWCNLTNSKCTVTAL